VEPCVVGGYPRGAHVQYINQDAGVPPQQLTRDLYEGGAMGWGHPKRVEPSDMDLDEERS